MSRAIHVASVYLRRPRTGDNAETSTGSEVSEPTGDGWGPVTTLSGGVRMRETASTSGAHMLTIPQGGRILIIYTAARNELWDRTQWSNAHGTHGGWVGSVLAGMLVGRGESFVHDLWGKINGAASSLIERWLISTLLVRVLAFTDCSQIVRDFVKTKSYTSDNKRPHRKDDEMMFELTPFSRGNSIFRLLDEVENNFFDTAFGTLREGNGAFRTDIREREDAYLLEAELPGFGKENIEIDLQGDTLIIRAKKDTINEEKDATGDYVRRERRYGDFQRSFDVSNIDTAKIKADYQNGILMLLMPKKGVVPPDSRRIEIGGDDDGLFLEEDRSKGEGAGEKT